MREPFASSRLVYLLVGVGFVVMFCSTSIKSVYQVYFSDLAEHFGRGRSDFAWSGSLFMLVSGLVSPLVGAISDRRGPLVTVVLGCVAGGMALVGAGSVPNSLPVFVMAYGLLGAFGLAAMTYVPMAVLVDRLFQKHKTGLAYAFVTNGTAISFILLSPFWLWLAPQVRWETTFLLTGLFFLIPLTALAWVAAVKAKAAGYGGSTAAVSHDRPQTWSIVRRDRGFYALAISFFGCGASMAFVDVHLVAFWMEESTPRSLMGWSLSLLGVLELLSGLLTGWLALRMSKRKLLGLFYLVRSFSILLLLAASIEMQALGFAALFGATYLGTVVLTSMFCLERYGPTIKGQAFGWLFLAHQVGAFASVQLGAITHDVWGSYDPFILGLAGVTAVGGLTSWLFLHDQAVQDSSKSGQVIGLDPAGSRSSG